MRLNYTSYALCTFSSVVYIYYNYYFGILKRAFMRPSVYNPCFHECKCYINDHDPTNYYIFGYIKHHHTTSPTHPPRRQRDSSDAGQQWGQHGSCRHPTVLRPHRQDALSLRCALLQRGLVLPRPYVEQASNGLRQILVFLGENLCFCWVILVN